MSSTEFDRGLYGNPVPSFESTSYQAGRLQRERTLAANSAWGNGPLSSTGDLSGIVYLAALGAAGYAGLIALGAAIEYSNESTMAAAAHSDYTRASKMARIISSVSVLAMTGMGLWVLEKSGIPEGAVTGFIASHPQGILAVVGTTLAALYPKSLWTKRSQIISGYASVAFWWGTIDGVCYNVAHHELNPVYSAAKAIADTDTISTSIYKWSVADLAPNSPIKIGCWAISKVATLPGYFYAGIGGLTGSVLVDVVRGFRATYRYANEQATSPQSPKPKVKISVNFARTNNLRSGSFAHPILV